MGLLDNLEESLYRRIEVDYKRNELRRPGIKLVTAPQRGRQSQPLAVPTSADTPTVHAPLGRCTDPST